MNRIALVTFLLIALSACFDADQGRRVASAPSLPPTNAALTGTAAIDAEEWALVGLINDYRAQNGMARLKISIALTRASDWLSVDMSTSGENIAAGHATAEDTFLQWKNSPPHNANMLNSEYRVLGIGRAYNPTSTYEWYWTTDFGSWIDATVD